MTTTETAFIGDIHGNAVALDGLARLILNDPTVKHTVFLGDYVNKGADSAGVLDRLLQISKTHAVTVLRGNHEAEMLKALDTGDLAAFLKLGGASTIRSYVRGPVGADVIADFRSNVPADHVQFLRAMPDVYQAEQLVASHRPWTGGGTRFRISAHLPVGDYPVIGANFAHLDTGCSSTSGRLTAFRWPSRTFTQVDSKGRLVGPDEP
ncbi:metallophosphoesterase [Mycolicibacterium sp.]|uniref:metallophosphoesterase n=1 Tax=Mycolicibacterium sp. TaxID=2320850 RepID=UPI0037C5E665